MSAPELSVQEAVDHWLAKQRADKSDQTVSAYRYRLKHFVEWCDDEDIEALAELNGWLVETYEAHRRECGLKTISLEKEMLTLRQFFRYTARVGLADSELPELVDPPKASPAEQSDDTRLDASTALALLRTYRNGGTGHHRLGHVFLELAWNIGARMGAIRGLDVEDLSLGENLVRFRHRPDTGTCLKNGSQGERTVVIQDAVADVLQQYLETQRHDVVDEHGRHPLLTTATGRPSTSTIRRHCYFATIPCRVQVCPHGRESDTCDVASRNGASKCPSSRSPHQIRTGSITWQLTRGVPPEVVSERVDASPEVIQKHYDKPNEAEATERQSKHLGKLGLG